MLALSVSRVASSLTFRCRCVCADNSPLGQPSCANGYLLNNILREQWNHSEAVITTDCGAVQDMRGAPAHAPSDQIAAAWTINNGTDLEMGSFLLLDGLANATRDGLTSEANITRAVTRTLRPLFRAGRFDAVDTVEWSKFGAKDVGAPLHLRIRDEAALQSFVLLKHDGDVLPLAAGKHIAVLGPQSSGQGLFSDYFGDDICCEFVGSLCCFPQGLRSSCLADGLGDHYQNNLRCVPTIASQIAALNVGGETTNATGVGISSTNSSGIAAALALGKAADVVVLALGIDKTIEHEGADRRDLALPGLQESFALQVLALGKPTVLVLTNGG